MKKVNIYSIGGVNHKKLGNYYKSLIEYNGVYKYIEGTINSNNNGYRLIEINKKPTSNRCIIKGIIEAVKLIKEPVKVVINTATDIGLKKAKKGAGVNFDLNKKLLDILEDKECKFELKVHKNKGEKLRSIINDKK